jgi:hypothetical protein
MKFQVFSENYESVCVGMVVISPMWWLPNSFQHFHHVAFDVKLNFFRKINEVA